MVGPEETVAGYVNFTELQNTCHVVQVLADSTEPIVVFPETVQERSLVFPAPGWQERNCTSPAPTSSRWGFSGVECGQCPDGQVSAFRTDLQRRQCRDCPAGKVFMALNAAEGFCLLTCSPGFFDNSSICDPCPNGTFRSEDMPSHTCRSCPLGHSSQQGTSKCRKCSVGAYGPAEGLRQCELCGPGSFTSAAGYSSCRTCPTGRFSATSGTSECQKCPSGAVANTSGASACDVCEPGTISLLDATRCERCALGQYQPAFGQSSCIKDHDGSSSAVPGTSTPSNAKGHFLVRYISVEGSEPLADIERCDAMPEACLKNELCAEGHAGRHCYSCLPGFISSGTCSRCPDRLYGVIFAGMYFFGYVIVIQLLMATVDLTSKKDCHLILFKILLNHCIAMAVLGAQIQRYITQAGLLRDHIAIKLILEILLATDGAPEGESSWFSLSCLMQPHLGAEERSMMNQMAAALHHDFDLEELRPAQDALGNYQRLNETFVVLTWNLLPFLVVLFSGILCYGLLDRYMRSRLDIWVDAADFYSQVCCFGGRIAAFLGRGRKLSCKPAQGQLFMDVYQKRLLGLFWPVQYIASFSSTHRGASSLLRFPSFAHFWRDHLPARAAVFQLMHFAVARRNLRALTCVNLGSRAGGISVLMRQGSVGCHHEATCHLANALDVERVLGDSADIVWMCLAAAFQFKLWQYRTGWGVPPVEEDSADHFFSVGTSALPIRVVQMCGVRLSALRDAGLRRVGRQQHPRSRSAPGPDAGHAREELPESDLRKFDLNPPLAEKVLMGFVYMQIARRDRETMRQMLAPIIRAVWADGRKPCLALISHPASRNNAGFSVEPTFCSNEMSSARRAAKTLQPTSCSSRFPGLTSGSPLIGVPARQASFRPGRGVLSWFCWDLHGSLMTATAKSDAQQYGIPQGEVLHTLLLGDIDGHTWFQFEGNGVHSVISFLLHMANYVEKSTEPRLALAGFANAQTLVRRPEDPLLIISLVLAFFWGVVYPSVIMRGLRRDVPRLSDPHVLKRWSTIINGYSRTVWWWEGAIFIRKFAFLVLEVLPVGSEARTLLFVVTCILSLYSHEVYLPFDSRQNGVLNHIERFQLWCALLPSLGGLILMQATGMTESRLPLYWTAVVAACFACHLGFLFAWCYAFFQNTALRAASWLGQQSLPRRRGVFRDTVKIAGDWAAARSHAAPYAAFHAMHGFVTVSGSGADEALVPYLPRGHDLLDTMPDWTSYRLRLSSIPVFTHKVTTPSPSARLALHQNLMYTVEHILSGPGSKSVFSASIVEFALRAAFLLFGEDARKVHKNRQAPQDVTRQALDRANSARDPILMRDAHDAGDQSDEDDPAGAKEPLSKAASAELSKDLHRHMDVLSSWPAFASLQRLAARVKAEGRSVTKADLESLRAATGDNKMQAESQQDASAASPAHLTSDSEDEEDRQEHRTVDLRKDCRSKVSAMFSDWPYFRGLSLGDLQRGLALVRQVPRQQLVVWLDVFEEHRVPELLRADYVLRRFAILREASAETQLVTYDRSVGFGPQPTWTAMVQQEQTKLHVALKWARLLFWYTCGQFVVFKVAHLKCIREKRRGMVKIDIAAEAPIPADRAPGLDAIRTFIVNVSALVVSDEARATYRILPEDAQGGNSVTSIPGNQVKIQYLNSEYICCEPSMENPCGSY
eukprot:s3726_g6.t4